MLVKDGQTDELFLGVVVDGEFVSSEGLADTCHCLLGQMLLEVLFIKYLQLKLGFGGCLLEVAHPELSEEGSGVSGSLQIHP